MVKYAGGGQISSILNPGPTTNSFPADRITHRHKSPVGEERSLLRESARDKGADPHSGARFPVSSGKHEAAGVQVAPPAKRGEALRPQTQRGVPSGGSQARDQFNRKAGPHEGYNSGSAKGDRGTAYKTWDGRTQYRGKSG